MFESFSGLQSGYNECFPNEMTLCDSAEALLNESDEKLKACSVLQ